MPLATDKTGRLLPIDCVINVPSVGELRPFILPEISDGKAATYADEPVIGRSFPIKTFSHSGPRGIGMKWHVIIMDEDSKTEAVRQLNAFRSCVYPVEGQGGAPYAPPNICTIDCGEMTRGTKDSTQVCAVLKSYKVSFPTDVAFDVNSFLPYKFDIDLEWDIVFATSQLPGSDKIIV